MLVQIGCGAVGSYLATALAKDGNSLSVWDGDTVERKNIQNQNFVNKYIGTNKAEALQDMYDNIHAVAKFWSDKDVEVFDADFIIMSADSMRTRRELATAAANKMCFDVRLIDSVYTIYACTGNDMLSSMNYADNDPDIVGLTPPCHMPSCRADLVLAAVAHQYRNIKHYMATGKPMFSYAIGNVDKGFHYEE